MTTDLVLIASYKDKISLNEAIFFWQNILVLLRPFWTYQRDFSHLFLMMSFMKLSWIVFQINAFKRRMPGNSGLWIKKQKCWRGLWKLHTNVISAFGSPWGKYLMMLRASLLEHEENGKEDFRECCSFKQPHRRLSFPWHRKENI